MIKLKSSRELGYTIIELLITITMISALATIGFVSYNNVSVNSRDSQRESKIIALANALDRYYEKNGEYPSCDEMTQSPTIITTSLLGGIRKDVFAMPGSDDGANSILPSCTDIIDQKEAIAYIGDDDSKCTDGIGVDKACKRFVLRYYSEKDNDFDIFYSRYGKIDLSAPNSPSLSVSLVDSIIQVLSSPVSCTSGTAQYRFNYRSNGGNWSGYSDWSSLSVFNHIGVQSTNYGFMAEARCHLNNYYVSEVSVSDEVEYYYETIPPCLDGFLLVPGSAIYGTDSFCVMKYEAKRVGSSTVPISQYVNSPWRSLSQISAIAYSQNVDGCVGCKLITDAEWLTIAQNVMGVDSNWTGGAVGSGSLYTGSDNESLLTTPKAASSNDNDGYYGTGDSASSNPEQKRTLTLSNGGVIWDLGGNAWEWTSNTVSAGCQPTVAGQSSYYHFDWTSITKPGCLSVDSTPGFSGIPNSDTWNANQGMGRVYSRDGISTTNAIARGGFLYGRSGWGNAARSRSGVYAMSMDNSPAGSGPAISFRVTSPLQNQ